MIGHVYHALSSIFHATRPAPFPLGVRLPITAFSLLIYIGRILRRFRRTQTRVFPLNGIFRAFASSRMSVRSRRPGRIACVPRKTHLSAHFAQARLTEAKKAGGALAWCDVSDR